MDWPSFFVEMTKALAWPVVVVVVVFALREPVSKLIKTLVRLKLKWKDFEAVVSISEQLEEAEEAADEAGLPEPATATTTGESETDYMPDEQLLELARTDPKGAVAAMWVEVEVAARNLAHRALGLSHLTFKGELVVIGLLQHGIIDSGTERVILDLWTMRNRVVHGIEGVTHDEAVKYVHLASRVLAKLDAAGQDVEASGG